ncbi:MAG TPA: alpha-2-macroglobulin family protein [Pyrinomonadaceae bacterium]|nr:alpha-2-macroglobulin family protein [Pyrinomonadaceae bacterium]
MSQRRLLSLFCLSLLFLLVVQLTRAGGDLSVNESRTRFVLHKDRAEVFLGVENTTGETRNANVKLELLDTHNAVLSETTGTQSVAPGSQTLRFDLPPIDADVNEFRRRALLWYRLRYRLVEAVRPSMSIRNGIISLSEITPHMFQLRVGTSETAREGGQYRARVQAAHPLTHRPAAGVHVNGEISFDSGDTVKPTASGITDKEGYAILSFVLPKQIAGSNGEIKVVGTRAGVVAEAEGEVPLDNRARTLITSDKVLYQPGQTMHLRAVVLNWAKRALANQNITIKIADPENTTVFVTTARSSRFGVVNADWQIPDNVRLGDYLVSVNRENDTFGSVYGVRVSRYELPNFSVSVEPDRKFYLPGQNAKVKVRADYLFGQPVKRGQVRVVQERQREWDFREQKWKIDEGDDYEGETDAQGIFVANVDLAGEQEGFSTSEYTKFKDLTFAAYFTDPTTNRTEQRRFGLRLTKEPIHVYVFNSEAYPDRNQSLPFEFYISTFYADGTPARCRLDVALTGDDDDETTVKRRIQTNRYGLAKTSLRFPAGVENLTDIDLKILAADAKGQSGKTEKELSLDKEQKVFVDTDKVLYNIGEPIVASIASSLPDQMLIVELANDVSVIRSGRVRLRNGRASVRFPYTAKLSDRITIAAYPDFTEEQEEIGVRTILYPANSELNLNVKTSQASYRPGEDASVRFNVRTSEGKTAESSLGVAIFDKAVDERIRTDQEFGQGYQPYNYTVQQFLGLDEQLSGVTFRDLRRLDMTKPVSPDLDLLAEVLLNSYRDYYPVSFYKDDYERFLPSMFGRLINQQLQPLSDSLHTRYVQTLQYPRDPISLRQILKEARIDFDSLYDPWGINYRPAFSIDMQMEVLTLTSAGADKRFETEDDFSVLRKSWEYFIPVAQKFQRAVNNYHLRTKGYIRDKETLRQELAREDFQLNGLIDHWGQPYRFEFVVQNTNYVIRVTSAGPDRRFTDNSGWSGDDFTISNTPIDYFAEPRTQIERTLNDKLGSTGKFPQSENELREALRDSQQPFESLRDPWERPYYVIFNTHSIYADGWQSEQRTMIGNSPARQTRVVPVTRTLATITVKSAGEDGKEGTPDDFAVANFSRIISEQTRTSEPDPITPAVVLSGTSGIHGIVTDSNGAVIPGVNIKATQTTGTQPYQTTTGDEGEYVLKDLPPGTYEVRFEATGFVKAVLTDVLVRVANLTQVNVRLEPGTVQQVVTIMSEGGSALNMMTDATVGRSVRELPATRTKSGGPSAQISTPRLREYFPETLVWQPSVETDARGRAEIKFKLADNITTWKMAVIGSTEDGRIGTAETEFKAFQPFFVEHDPPRVLTEGDEISLPVVVRNYLDRVQKVDLEIKGENWFSLTGPARKQTAVAAGDAARQTFDFRVVSSVDDGRQRITALAGDANDAIEKPVTVHPDGEELSVTAGDLLTSSASLELNLPDTIITNSTRAELKIYPNLMAHAIESVEAIMQRPYGCGEQTISSTYPSLLLLRNYKQNGDDFPLRGRAERYLKSGYTRLLSYRDVSGGFSYWADGSPDIALTAYALRFLTDAAGVMEVDDDVVKEARQWLMKQQGSDGSWPPNQYGADPHDRKRALTTAYIARIIAATESRLFSGTAEGSAAQERAKLAASLKLALEYISQRSNEIDEPYLLASYALALIEMRDIERARPVIKRLHSLALSDGVGTYWALETNTPFYGWGLAGRVETTALAVQGFRRFCSLEKGNCDADNELVKRGLLFLVKQKDRYGVWYSTQATINVLDTMLTVFATNSPNRGSETEAQIEINGRVVQRVKIPETRGPASPITIPITTFVANGKNRIEIKRTDGRGFSSVQALATYYVPWTDEREKPASTELRLLTKFDKTESKIGDSITCHVEAERVGFRGYGMMLAEIGLPPGAEVDRSSLETARKDWTITQYDVLPDRIVLYLWPRAGGVKFDFQFRPRFGLAAKTAPSVIYDYYNPESRVVLPPVKFRVN